MPAAPPEPLPHGPLTEVFPDVFWLRGGVRMGPGVTINRLMVVLRDGEALTVINAVRPQDPSVLDALGKVTNVVRIGLHGMDDAWYRAHYGVTHWSLPELCATDRLLTEAVPVPWMTVIPFQHTAAPEAAVLLDRAEGVLVTCDSLQHWPDTEGCSLLAKGLTKVMGFQKHAVQIGPPWRKRMTPEGGSLEPDFQRLAALDFDHLIGAHGAPKVGGAKAELQKTIAATFG